MRCRLADSRSFRSDQRASVLVTALIFATVIGISLTSYLSLSRSSLAIAQRGLYLNAAIDLAEVGIEQGLWALNATEDGDATAWNGWSTAGSNASRKFNSFNYGGGVTGEVNVFVGNYNSTPPYVIAKSTITLQDKSEINRWIRITTASRSLFAHGLTARDTITASGGAWVDSWKSDPDNDPSTPAIPWSSGVALDNGSIATASTATPAISLGSADIYGTAAVGASSSAGLAMSWGGQVGPRGMSISGPYNVAPGVLGMSFSATFEPVTVPTGATVTSPYVLPRSVSGPPWYLSTETIGTAGSSTYLQMDKITVEGAATLTIDGDVTFYLPPSSIETVKVAGSGRIELAPGASLKIYTPGDINISGAGIANSAAPENVQIWSNRNGSSGQSISLSGSGGLGAIVYAPDADLTLPGSTDFAGAAVVNSAVLSGSGAFHYDESLKNFGSGGSITVDSYEELDTPAKRAPYISDLTF